MTNEQVLSEVVDRKMKPLLAALGVVVLLGIAASFGSSRTASSHSPADPPRFTSMSSLLSSDATKVSSDLGLVAADTAQGQSGTGEPACYNLQNNVTPDATALGRFVSDDVDNDVKTLQADINTLEANIASFNQDIADFVNDGVQQPAGATGAITEIRDLIASEITSANGMIAAMQNNVNTAYTDGNNLASGACKADGPGSAPTIPTLRS